MSYRRVPAYPDHAADEAQGEGGREGEASGLDVGHYPGGGGDHAVDVEDERSDPHDQIAGHAHLETSH